MSDSPEPVIYQLKVALLGISPMIWRRLLVKSDSTIFRFALHATDSNGVGRPLLVTSILSSRRSKFFGLRGGGCLLGSNIAENGCCTKAQGLSQR
ncbi:hypothetical protein H6G20_19995 [Desertifilum sp. FACHB-1129]|uniref:IS1096 element passenger TnpR family protein n=1 Tax=Desertifilum tharense IPPAS B-1220 TaxID=1781255 RepID=A0ACD5GPI8_9CYAN|nr:MULTISPECIES: hypothetical protein [Desertifilum]MBD2313955.1 hypothetical protein [Desertifilum sp. FACHB-1129]MBD2324787.1 hypothetical protein [Desertifilum sp. FACHB-866]MBD2334819.1 hypothetical protein [Desertifilum sp. FACHB-868]MDA0210408.1 hypothetical protein [Cyanobacteria bacterium FC1]